MTIQPINGLYPRAPSADEMCRFVAEVIGQKQWSKQIEITRSVADNRRTLVRSCTGAGKTKVAADIALAWLFTGPYRCVVTTAPTMRQIKELLWKEIRKNVRAAELRGAPLGGVLPPSAPEFRLDDDWLAIGFSSNDDVNFQGWHSPGGTLFILDEAIGVPPPVWAAIKGTLVGDWDRLLAIANPTIPEGEFFALHKSGSVNKIRISAFDTPNVVADEVVIPGLTTKAWIDEVREDWGEDSALWRARVLGEFPEEGAQVIVPLGWAEAAIERWKDRNRTVDPDDPRDKPPPSLDGGEVDIGLDVARFGEDKTVMATATFAAAAIRVGTLAKASSRDTMEVAGWAKQAMAQLRAANLRVDGDGVGGGVVDRLVEDGVKVAEMRAGSTPMDASRFANAKAEWAWNLREALRPDAPIPLELPPDNALLYQMTTMRYRIKGDGKIIVESKEEWRKRTGKPSPDEFDAVVMALARGYKGKRGGGRFAIG